MDFGPILGWRKRAQRKKLSRSGGISFGLQGSGTIPIVHDSESNFLPQIRLTLHTGRMRRTQSPLISTT